MRLYADAAALAAYPGGDAVPAADVDTLLRTASRMVDQLLRARAYDVDDVTELPTDADEAQAMSDATCAIAVELSATGATTAGASQAWQSVKIGNVALSGPRTESATTALGLPVPAIAVVHLSDVGTTVVWT